MLYPLDKQIKYNMSLDKNFDLDNNGEVKCLHRDYMTSESHKQICFGSSYFEKMY